MRPARSAGPPLRRPQRASGGGGAGGESEERGSAALVGEWEDRAGVDGDGPLATALSPLFTIAYAVALFAPKPASETLTLHIVETAPARVALLSFDWRPLRELLLKIGYPCQPLEVVVVNPHLADAQHAATKPVSMKGAAKAAQDCAQPFTVRYHKNFYDRTAAVTNVPAIGAPEQAVAGSKAMATTSPDAVIWLNVDAYMCPWRYSLLAAIGTNVPVFFSAYDPGLSSSLQVMLTGAAAFGKTFGAAQQELCNDMSQKLYNFKWMAHRAAQNWTALLEDRETLVNPAHLDVFLPVAPNLFTAKDRTAPRWTDPKTLVTRPLELNAALLGLWHDKDRVGVGAKSGGKRGARMEL